MSLGLVEKRVLEELKKDKDLRLMYEAVFRKRQGAAFIIAEFAGIPEDKALPLLRKLQELGLVDSIGGLGSERYKNYYLTSKGFLNAGLIGLAE